MRFDEIYFIALSGPKSLPITNLIKMLRKQDAAKNSFKFTLHSLKQFRIAKSRTIWAERKKLVEEIY